MFGTWAGYDGHKLPNRPAFYTTASDAAVEAVEGLQAEAAAVVAALSAALGLASPPAIPDLRADLEACYGPAIADPRTLGSLLHTNAAYRVGGGQAPALAVHAVRAQHSCNTTPQPPPDAPSPSPRPAAERHAPHARHP